MRTTQRTLREKKIDRLRREHSEAWNIARPRRRTRAETPPPEIRLGERPLPVAKLLLPYLVECWAALWAAGLGTCNIGSLTEKQYADLPDKARKMVYKRVHLQAHFDTQPAGRDPETGERLYTYVWVPVKVSYFLKTEVSYEIVDKPFYRQPWISPEADARRDEIERQILGLGEHDVYGTGCSCFCCRRGSPVRYERSDVHIRRELNLAA